MLFSSLTFLFVFLPVLLLVYFGGRRTFQNAILLTASLIFYAWGKPDNLVMLLFCILLNYLCALGIDYIKKEEWFFWSKGLLLLTVVINLGFLVYFKYIPGKNIVMPIGISFFTFQAISYVVDVYREDVTAQKDIRVVALYIAMFPQLIAGPIVRYGEIEGEVICRQISGETFLKGFKRFIVGLGKKVLLANQLAAIADHIYGQEIRFLPASVVWIGAVAYLFQIYFDFSGYSDMAIGLGEMFGFHFPENFNYPYISKSIAQFWRRWHMSLSGWFRDYLYIPLGGNRKGAVRTALNQMIVFLCTGIWHGATWNCLVWGIYYGTLLVIERRMVSRLHWKKEPWWFPALSHGYTLLVVLIGFVIFRTDTLYSAASYLTRMFCLSDPVVSAYEAQFYMNRYHILLFVCAIFFSMPVSVWWKGKKSGSRGSLLIGLEILEVVALMGILCISVMQLISASYNPFIYFRF